MFSLASPPWCYSGEICASTPTCFASSPWRSMFMVQWPCGIYLSSASSLSVEKWDLEKSFLWWGVEWVLPQTFHQFVRDWNEGMSPWLSKGWKLVGPCTIWYVWLARNNLVFNNKVTCWSDTVTKIKHKSFQWALDSKMCSSNDFHMWMSQPLALFGPIYNS